MTRRSSRLVNDRQSGTNNRGKTIDWRGIMLRLEFKYISSFLYPKSIRITEF